MLAGNVLAARTHPERPLVVATSLVLLTAPSSALLALAAPVPLIMLTDTAKGVAVGFFVAVWPAILQEQIPSETLGRVSAWDWMASFALTPLGYVLAGPMAQVYMGSPAESEAAASSALGLAGLPSSHPLLS